MLIVYTPILVIVLLLPLPRGPFGEMVSVQNNYFSNTLNKVVAQKQRSGGKGNDGVTDRKVIKRGGNTERSLCKQALLGRREGEEKRKGEKMK